MKYKKLKNLIKTLKITPEIISEYFSKIPESELDIKRGEGFWTLREHLIHLDHVQDVLFERIIKFKKEEVPVITPYFPEDDKIEITKFKTINEVLDSYKLKRNKQLTLFNQLKKKDLEKSAKHDEFKIYNLEIILNHILFHDYFHMYRVEELWLAKDEYLSK